MLDPKKANSIIGESLLQGESVASEFRSIFSGSVTADIAKRRSVFEIVNGLTFLSTIMTPILAEAFYGSKMNAWLAAFKHQTNQMPPWLLQALYDAGNKPPDRPFLVEFDRPGDERIRFPKIEAAARTLLKRRVMDRQQFDILSDRAKAESFTIAGDLSDRTIAKVRDTLAKTTYDGASLDKFSKEVSERIGKSAIGPGHLENVYRTNLQAAFRDGQASVMANPVVASVFPYIEYIPISDSRTRDTHSQLGKLGIDGTGIYRREDPFWSLFTPPWDFQCRCSTNNLTIEAAARKGVKEAQKWLETGQPPEEPEYRLQHIPFPHNPGFGQRHGNLVVV